MSAIEGQRSVEIEAAVERCFAIAADLESAPTWQRSLRAVTVLERDPAGRPVLVDTEWDASVRSIRARLRVTYDAPSRVAWLQEQGDLSRLSGSWTLEDLGESRTRATYVLSGELGGMLGMLLRGSARDGVVEHLVGGGAAGLKARAEAG